jgi:hypothetical protein
MMAGSFSLRAQRKRTKRKGTFSSEGMPAAKGVFDPEYSGSKPP